jgi:probable HAF family extracellular repeat protein
MHDLGRLGGTLSMPGSLAYLGGTRVLNEAGEVACTSTLEGDEARHAFLWSHGTLTDLGTLGGSISEALAINNRTQIVGRARLSNEIRHPFSWQRGEMTDLGVVAPCIRGTAFGVNNGGQIVGGLSACTADPNDIAFETAFYVEVGQPMAYLNSLIFPASVFHVTTAIIISDRGEILAHGLLPNGAERAVLLVPISR